MRYMKPQLVRMGSGITAILSGECAKSNHSVDSSAGCSPETHETNGAYEADE